MSYPTRNTDQRLSDELSFAELGLESLGLDELFWPMDYSTNNALEHVFDHDIYPENLGVLPDLQLDGEEDMLSSTRGSPPEPRRTPVNGTVGPLEVLIFEQNSQAQRKLERMLSSLGCRAIVASTQQRALQYISNSINFDLVFVGLVTESNALAQNIRAAHPANSNTPVLAITAGLQGIEELKEFDMTLELPLNKAKLEDAINIFYPRDALPGLASRDDPESDCSWTAADDDEEWQFAFKGHLRRFHAQSERVSLMTPPLLSKQRRKIHAMAHLYRLSHTSLGCGKYKRVLILKCRLLKPSSTLNRWNPSHSQWMEGIVDPRIIVLSGSVRQRPNEAVTMWLQQAHLPAPALVSSDEDRTAEAKDCIHMLFEHPSDAAVVLEAVHGTTPSWSSSTVTCDYALFKNCFWSPWQIPADFEAVLAEKIDVTMAHEIFRKPKLESRASSIFTPSEDETASESELSDNNTYARSTNSSRYSAQTTNPSTASFSTYATSSASRAQKGKHKKTDSTSLHSLAATTSSLPTIPSDAPSDTDTSTLASNSRKRRLPYSPSGYQCSHPSCTKTFDHAGDCRKHEKIHEDRSHICEICGKTFLYPKDVRRHCQNVHKWKESLMQQRAERRVRPS
ncbi:hypothetical protein PRZ48_005588 [Zasmidium cellare]|uniref:Uncharacterized protein n=1 Tax=Zasmidium cellare TaxID=395010 RepID=A0ABR0EMX4_ZASCE|nr:hypothetical protein PRZ48_005588 [Zasmidium cellare]